MEKHAPSEAATPASRSGLPVGGLVAVALAALLVYLSALDGDFVWDDRILIVDNASLQSWTDLGPALTRDFFHRHEEQVPYGYYRPVVTLSYVLDAQLWGLEPRGFHLTNLLLHATNCVLVALLLARCGVGRGASMGGALLFAVHPIHTENVAWISGRTDLMAFLWTAAAFLLHSARGRRPRTSAALRVLAVTAFALALLSKEMSLVLVPWLMLFERLSAGRSWASIARRTAPYLAAVAGYVLWRFAWLEVDVPSEPPDHGLVPALLTAPLTVLRYVSWMVLPLEQSAYVQNPYVRSLLDVRFVGPSLVLALASLAAFRVRAGAKRTLLLGMLAASFVPLLNLVRIGGPADMGSVMAERFCYFPSFALMGLFALLASEATQRRRPSELGLVRPIGLAVLVALACWATVRRISVWRDEQSFVTATLAAAPEAPLMWRLLARLHMQRAFGVEHLRPDQQWRATEPDPTELRLVARAYGRATELDPQDAGAWHNLGMARYRLGELDAAVEAFRRAIEREPSHVKAHINLGAVLHDGGAARTAIQEYRTALRILDDTETPGTPTSDGDRAAAHYNLARSLLDLRDVRGAVASLRESLGVRPELYDRVVGEAVGRIRDGGDLPSGRALLELAVEVRPERALARIHLAQLLVHLGLRSEARHSIEQALALASGPDADALARYLEMLDRGRHARTQ